MFFKRKYPCILQHDASDCAAAALANVCKFYKKEMTIMKIRELIGTDAYGTSIKGIVQGAEKLGFTVKAVKILIEEVDVNYSLPAIAHVKTKEGLSHFVVINKIKNGKLNISDPAIGERILGKNEFTNHFLGALILLVPKSEFELLDYKKASMFKVFKTLMLPQKRILLIVISVSFILTIIGLLSSLFSKIIFDEIIPYQLKKSLYIYMVIFGIISLVQLFLSTFRSYILLFLSRKIDIPVMLGYYNHVLRLKYNFFATRKVGDILTRFQDSMTIKEIFSKVSISLVLDSILASVTGVILWNINFSLFMIILVTVLIDIALIYGFKKSYKTLNYEEMEAGAWLNSQLIESVKNIETVKAYTNESEQIEKLENRFVSTMKLSYREGILSIIQGFLSSGAGSISNILLIGMGALSIISGKLSLGDLIVFQTLSGYFVDPIQNLVSLQLTFQEAQVAMHRLTEIMDLDTEQFSDKELLSNIDLRGDIEFSNVTFRYGSRQEVLHEFQVIFPSGKKIAIIGESGAGKSTIVKLLMKFYENEKGKILLNGYNLKDISSEYLRQHVGYVAQRVELFHGTILDNIRIGFPNATYEQVISACKRAGCHEFIQKIPGRYSGIIEEGGSNLSGGEQQKIAIARAILKKRELYIFDESTSNLDSFSEKEIQKLMLSSTEDVTTIIIAHRLSTIVHCDLIILMENGKVIESGNHKELLKRSAKYREMINIQQKGKSKDSKTQQTITRSKDEEILYE